MHNKKKFINATLIYLVLTVGAVIAAFPLIWIILSAFKTGGEISNNPLQIFPKNWSLENFRYVLVELDFGINVRNSLIVSTGTTIITIIISALGAYGIVRFFPKVGQLLTRLLITTYMFPTILLAIPFSVIIGQLRLVDSFMGLIIVYLSFSIPYAIWLLVGFFETVPLGIEEAARIDGATKWQVFTKVVLPIVAPGVTATAVYTFINAWNEFLYGLILINSRSKMTISVALNALENQEIFNWGHMMAASTIVVLPSVIFFLLIQRRIAGGLTEGSVK